MRKTNHIGWLGALLSGVLAPGCLSQGPNYPPPMTHQGMGSVAQAPNWNQQYTPMNPRGGAQGAAPNVAPVQQTAVAQAPAPPVRLTTTNNLAAQQQAANRLLQGTTPAMANTATAAAAVPDQSEAQPRKPAPQMTMVPVLEPSKGSGMTMTVPLAVKVSVQPMTVETMPAVAPREPEPVTARSTVPPEQPPSVANVPSEPAAPPPPPPPPPPAPVVK